MNQGGEYLDGPAGLVKVIGELLLKAIVVGTACLVTLASCFAYLACKLKLVEGDLGWPAVTGMAGLGFTTIVAHFFWSRGPKRRSAKKQK